MLKPKGSIDARQYVTASVTQCTQSLNDWEGSWAGLCQCGSFMMFCPPNAKFSTDVSEKSYTPKNPVRSSQGFFLKSICKREKGAMLAAQPEVLFTYPSPTGDYEKIGWPSLQDRVRCLTRCSPRDDHGKVASVTIQRPRPDSRAAGVTRLGPDCRTAGRAMLAAQPELLCRPSGRLNV